MSTRVLVFFILVLLGCDRPSSSGPAPTHANAPSCGDVVGAWSSVVDGLRARLVTSGSKPDKSSLRIVLEIENVSDQPLEIHWDGLYLGFQTFRLEDATGNDVEPPWRLPGNAPSGKVRAVFPPAKVVTYELHRGPFEKMKDARILRIGAFWGRELDGSRRLLRSKVMGVPKLEGAAAYEGQELATNVPPGRVWTGPLEVPGVCVE